MPDFMNVAFYSRADSVVALLTCSTFYLYYEIGFAAYTEYRCTFPGEQQNTNTLDCGSLPEYSYTTHTEHVCREFQYVTTNTENYFSKYRKM